MLLVSTAAAAAADRQWQWRVRGAVPANDHDDGERGEQGSGSW